MPNKSKKNAFCFFMQDCKIKEERKNGRRFGGGFSTELANLASEKWTQMTVEERLPYVRQAKESKHTVSRNNDQYTSQGVAYSTIEKARNLAAQFDAAMHLEINDLVKNSFLENTVASQPYYFIAANYFCKMMTDNHYFPAELALLRYTLADGCTRKFHSFINPGRLPPGYALEAQERSRDTHGLAPPPNAIGESNYTRLVADLVQFISDNGGDASDALPPLFTDEPNVPAIRAICDRLCDEAGDRAPTKLRVYPLKPLFFVLRNEASRNSISKTTDPFPTANVAQQMLDCDRYSHRDEIACAFHRKEDRSRHCALSVVTRYAYTISDHVCQDLDIVLKPGKHVPTDADVSVKMDNDPEQHERSRSPPVKSWSSSARDETRGRRSPYERPVTPKSEYKSDSGNWNVVGNKKSKESKSRSANRERYA